MTLTNAATMRATSEERALEAKSAEFNEVSEAICLNAARGYRYVTVGILFVETITALAELGYCIGGEQHPNTAFNITW